MEKIKHIKALRAKRRSLEQKKETLQKDIVKDWKAIRKECRPAGIIKGLLKSIAV
jgi:hypothetical protein